MSRLNKVLVDLDVIIHHETKLAIFVSDNGDVEKAVWLPKAAIEIERKKGDNAMIILPERMAIDKGLI